MSAVRAAQEKLRKAQDALRSAERRAADELAARTARNAERRRKFADELAGSLPARSQAVQEARTGVFAAVAEGGDAVAAYVAYVAAHETYKRAMNHAANELVTYVDSYTRKPNPPGDRTGVATYPTGISPLHSDPVPLTGMLQEAAEKAGQERGAADHAELVAPLNAELEPEDD